METIIKQIHEGHLERYLFAQKLVAGKKVLDAACGFGEGTALIGKTAISVIGIDIDPANLGYAREHHASANVSFAKEDVTKLPYADNAFEAAVSLETIEHLYAPEQEKYLAELRRVVVAGGTILISTPDREMWHRMAIKQHDHVRELTKKELIDLLGRYFDVKAVYGQQKMIRISRRRRMVREVLNVVKRADRWGLRYRVVPAKFRHSLDLRTTPVDQSHLRIEPLQESELASALFVVCENRK